MIKQAIILCGGLGSRLSSRLNGLPKPLVNVGGRPLLQHQIEELIAQGIEEILLLVSYRKELIEDFIQHKNFPITIKLIEDGKSKGNGGALLNAYDDLHEIFYVIYGDTFFNINLEKFSDFGNRYAYDAILLAHPNDHPEDSDLLISDRQNRLVEVACYPHSGKRIKSNIVNAAFYLFRKRLLNGTNMAETNLDIAKDLIPEWLRMEKLIYVYNSAEYIKDAGTPERLDKVVADYNSGKIKRSSYKNKMKAVFLDRDGTVNRYVPFLKRVQDFELLPGVAEAIAHLNISEYLVILITNQPVIARGECTLDHLNEIHMEMHTQLSKERAYLDDIFFCPHHPDSGFEGEIPALKIACDCRKPNIGMIQKAAAKHNIDLAESWIIGDSNFDIELAANAGLRSILVETGQGFCEATTLARPTIKLPTLSDAVRHIMKLDTR